MTKRLIVILSSIILLAMAFTGCDLSDSGSDQGDTDYILSGYYWLAGDEDGVVESDSGRASVNIGDLTNFDPDSTDYPFDTLIAKGVDGNKVTNYPIKGQFSYFTVTEEELGISPNPAGYIGTLNVYKIAVNTEFQKKEDIFDHYQEEYYILDVDKASATTADSDGNWTMADLIVTKESGSWVIDSKAREVMELHYQDDSARYEWIVSELSDEEYAHFEEDVITTIPDSSWTATAGAGMSWSSKVYFYQKVNNWVDFWYEENKEVYGIRYYTETADGRSTSISFERFVTKDSLSDISTLTDSDVEDMVFGDLPAGAETLSESVTWYEISTNNKKTTKTYATVNPTFKKSFNIEMISEYDL